MTLPSGWTTMPLSEIADVRLGRQRSPANHAGTQMRNYLRAANIGWNGLKLDDVKEMNFTDQEMLTYQLRLGDLLLSEASGSPGEVGKPALWADDLVECAFQNTLLRVRPFSIESKFLMYYFRFIALTGGFIQHSRGVGIHHLGRARLASWPTPIPTAKEQAAIVEILDDHLYHLEVADSYIDTSRRRLAATRERLIMDAITGFRVPGNRLPSGLMDVGTNDENLPSLPEDWSWARLGDIADLVGGVTKDAKKQAAADSVEVPYLRVANVQRARLALETVTTIRVPAAKARSLALIPGDVLLNEGGDRDKLARGWVWEGQIEPCIHQNHVFRARIRGGVVDPRFLAWTTNTIGGRWAERNGKQSVNLASISLSMIRKMPVIIPPNEFSEVAMDELEVSLAATDRIGNEIDRAANRGQLLRRALLAAAFSGRLTGRRSDDDLIAEMAGV